MTDLDALILDLCEWLAKEPRAYEDVMDAWRTSCPRLTVWEDAMERGFVTRERMREGERMVMLTEAGRRFLAVHGRLPLVVA
ncbi:MAG: hypothetical protein KKB37_03675 [Alphaproteobacteria bacterium]|nr:hypothetical protein [Alphaproteobacteria bacterium]